MKNSLALVITEEDVTRIREMYPNVISEQQTDVLPPEIGGVEGIKKFQDWLDSSGKDWLGGGKKLNKGKGYGSFGPKTKAAWGTYKDEYLKTLSDANNQDKTMYAYNDGGQASSWKTRKEIDDLIKNGTITSNTYLYTKEVGWQKASSFTNLADSFDIIPAPPTGPIQATTTTTTKAPTSSAVDKLYGGKLDKNPDDYNPMDNSSIHPYTLDGFKTWYKERFSDDVNKYNPTLDEKTKTVTIQSGSKKLIYSYNDILKTWNMPQELNPEQGVTTVEPAKKVSKKSEPQANLDNSNSIEDTEVGA